MDTQYTIGWAAFAPGTSLEEDKPIAYGQHHIPKVESIH